MCDERENYIYKLIDSKSIVDVKLVGRALDIILHMNSLYIVCESDNEAKKYYNIIKENI